MLIFIYLAIAFVFARDSYTYNYGMNGTVWMFLSTVDGLTWPGFVLVGILKRLL